MGTQHFVLAGGASGLGGNAGLRSLFRLVGDWWTGLLRPPPADPGYPRQGADEDDSAFRYRRDRDAAHVDGLHRIMPGRRRKLLERHAYILGIPLNDATDDAAPFVVWEGGHKIMKAAFAERFAGIPPDHWAEEDITDAYQAARREVFGACARVLIHAKVGEAFLVHRHALHGVAPWPDGTGRRAIAYFRPEFASGAGSAEWLTNP